MSFHITKFKEHSPNSQKGHFYVAAELRFHQPPPQKLLNEKCRFDLKKTNKHVSLVQSVLVT